MADRTDHSRGKLIEITKLFLRFGITGFGGPAAHISMFHDEIVKRRKWLDDQQFLDLLGATNLIPGPNSTEMAIHIGYLRAGWAGLILAGASFILPAMAIVIILAWIYVAFGNAPQAGWMLYGVQPVIIAIILQAIAGLGRKAVKGIETLAAVLISVVIYYLNLSPLLSLIVGALFVFAVQQIRLIRSKNRLVLVPFFLYSYIALTAVQPINMQTLFFTFLKIGSVLYGSGYVLIAFLYADFVERLGWITNKQLLDAIAIGQLTPGPVFTTATFIGFLLAGLPGSIIATIGIFLPSFIFVAISNPYIPRLRSSPLASSFLDGLNAASLGLMAAVFIGLARSSIVDPLTIAVSVISAILLFVFRVNTTWLILGGLVVGMVSGSLR